MAKTEPRASVYVALVHETLKLRPFDSLEDLAEEVKIKCARLKFVYDGRRVWDAIEHVDRIRKITLVGQAKQPEPLAAEGRPLSHSESVEILDRLGLGAAVKRVPEARVKKIDIHGDPPEEDFSYEVY